MRLLPYFQETVVLPFSGEETAMRLRQHTRPLEKGFVYEEEAERNFLFNGWVADDHFRISRKIKHPENFLPLIVGRIEGTSAGSILFLQYRLFFSTTMLLIFWSVIALLFSLFFTLFHINFMYAALTLGLGIFNYIIAVKNFHLQIRSSKKALNQALISI